LPYILAKEAERLSWDKSYNSPFAQKAKENNFAYCGGKPDDITIIIAQVFDDANGKRGLRYSDSYKENHENKFELDKYV
jgi:hypothetical protein